MAIADEIIPFTESGRITGVRLANFRNDSDEPLASHKEWISKFFIPVMAKNPGARVRMVGMASRNGDASYNMALSKRRIDKVAGLIQGKVNIVEKNPRGEIPAAEDGFKDGDRSGRYRAVLLRWEGLSGPVPVPPGPQPGPVFKKKVIKTQPGVWLIIGVDTFGIPIKFLSAGRIVVTLLNDKGEQWAISGFGVGTGLGAEFGAGQAKGLIAELKKVAVALGLKLGDVPNMADKVKDLLPDLPSATSGGVFRKGNIVSNFTIQEIVAKKKMTVLSTGMGVGVAAGEGGVIIFDSPLGVDATFDAILLGGKITAGLPWGLYTSLGTAKLAAEIGGMVYGITGVQMKGILEKEVLDLS
jgi:hypothetical protein